MDGDQHLQQAHISNRMSVVLLKSEAAFKHRALADPAPAAACCCVRSHPPSTPPFSKRLSLGDSFEREFFFLMPSRKTAPLHSGATSTRPQRAAATKAATAIKSAATTKAAAAAAKPLTKAVSKKRSQTSKAKSIRGPANTKKSKDGEDGVSAAAYAKEFRSMMSLDQAILKLP